MCAAFGQYEHGLLLTEREKHFLSNINNMNVAVVHIVHPHSQYSDNVVQRSVGASVVSLAHLRVSVLSRCCHSTQFIVIIFG